MEVIMPTNSVKRIIATGERSLIVCLIFALALVAGSCKEDDVAAPAPANLDAFFASLPSWESVSPELPESNDSVGATTSAGGGTIDGDSVNCTETAYSLTTTPEKMTTLNPDVEILWVGSLLQGKGYIGGIGSLAELPIRQRAPVALSIDLLRDSTSSVVANPTVATVSQAIGGLISSADAAGHKAGSNIFFTSEVTHSVVQAMLKVGVSAKYAGATIKASLGVDLSEEKRTVMAYFVQQMFTVSMVLPQYPKDVFSSAFTQELLDRETAEGRMASDNLPVYVSSIVYGRILVFSFTSTSSETKINQTLNVLYNGGDFDGNLEDSLKQVLDNAQIRVVTVGGDADDALALIRGNKLAEFFASDAPLTTAKPISYTIRNLKDNSIARVSETTTYNLKECVPVTLTATGAKYLLTLDRIQAISLVPLTHKAILTWDLSIRDVMGTHSAAKNTLLSTAVEIREGGSHSFVNPTPVEVVIHYDGRDHVEIPIGILRDWWYPAPLTYTFELGQQYTNPKQYKWPSAKLPNDDKITVVYITRVVDKVGNTFRFYYRKQRVGLLYD